MRLASYNVENLFDRAKAMNQSDWAEGKPILEKFAALNALLGELTYTAEIKEKMVVLMNELGLKKSDTGPFVILRRNRGKLLTRPKDGGKISIIAEGRADWVGSLELRSAPVDETAMLLTAQVMIDLRADILAVVEAESRPALQAFNSEILPARKGAPFEHVMVIDGNDERGIDVGLMTANAFPIDTIRSHVDDKDRTGALIFSRDCPEFAIPLNNGETLHVLVNHLKSKGYGSKDSSDARRKAQAERVKAIYQQRVKDGETLIAIMGDFNDTPDSQTLAPLLKETDLRDIFTHEKFDNGGYPGTWGSCTASNKIDYILLSPALWEKVTQGGVYRKGMWPGVRPAKWETYAELKKPVNAGSDHAAVWVELDI
ncbi:endonuclease/exonuclease/phosphatase family protein [Kosakonia sp. ML.JS2a]|uniref:endonuclease/exonuclease/phosphatase family protein n=1 Tax=Kosakonia sp. ML.JS2a TaxID=2980557 RepID=UPI0021D997BF|nr:endonuclease/exonuclease/phosphatase family protein [Kosakonia sp. ML.JS2a]UXY08781.1 endonuclease/exonuclease/phosphatase family protein [Kosakonia sp. ML.JS2a]